jgi:hypothetical protein
MKTGKKIQVELIGENAFFCEEKEFRVSDMGCTIVKEDHSYNIPWTSVLWYRIDG